jgi:uncharacterized protein YlxP (DUF503 family)
VFVGIGRVVLRLPGARSLKDRRRVVNGYKDRLKARLSVSVAEVGETEDHRTATLGIALVAREAGEADELLARALNAADQLADAVVAERSRRVLPWHSGLSEEGLSEEGWSEDGWSEDGWSEETDE